jgi:hypoxanthine phosphoribosyltransferase
MSNDPNNDETSLVAKVPQLKDVVLKADFRPHVIIGIARSGLVIAAHLSREFGKADPIPVISLWPHPEMDNPLNRTIKSYFKSEANRGKTMKVLIVDDICRSGGTLARARNYVEESMGRSIFKVETAAIAYYDRLYSQSIPPTFFVYSPGSAITDAQGEEELVEEPPPVAVDEKVSKNQDVPRWFPIAGFALAVLALLFLMSLIVLSVFGREIPMTSRFILVAFLALAAGLSLTFLGGSAAARGDLTIPVVGKTPISFGVTGGIAAFVIVLVLGYALYVR